MNGGRILGVAARLVGVVLGLGVLALVWRNSDKAEHPPTTKTWIEQLGALDCDDRKQAVEELGGAGAGDLTAVMSALTTALEDGDASVRSEAALAMGRCLAAALEARGSALIERARDGITCLTAVLEHDGDMGVRASAAFASAGLVRAALAAGIKPDPSKNDDPIDPKILAKAFIAAIKRDPATRLTFLVPYEMLGPQDEPAPEVVLAALDDPSQAVRIQALLVLSQFNRGVDAAVPVLLKEAASIDPKSPPSGFRLRPPLRQAAERLHPTPGVVPLLVKGLESPNLDVRSMALVLLERLGPDARVAAPGLVTAAKAMIRSTEGSTEPSGTR